jgi:hypothetical protein
MTDPSPSVVTEVEAFCERHAADPASVEATGLRFLFDDTTTDEIDAALAELHARSNGTGEVGDP